MGFIILIILALGYCLGLYFWFEKAGETGWKAFVPYMRISTWVKLTNKPKSFIFWSFVPVVNLFIYANLLGETSDSYKRYSFWEHALAIALGFVWLPFLGKKADEKYYGPSGESDGVKKPEKHWVREWTDAIFFAIFAAYFIRTFIFEIYMIPTSSMEGTLRVGDFLVVSKFHYGSRVPNTPIAFPLVHHTFPNFIPLLGGQKSYTELIKLDYSRLPKLQSIKRNDMVVFNFPANDTLTREYDSKVTYYDLVRDAEKNGISNGKQYVKDNYTVMTRPVDKRENYIKRCVGIAGDTLEIKEGKLFIDSKPAYQAEHIQFNYSVLADGTNPMAALHDLDITDFQFIGDGSYRQFLVSTTEAQAAALKERAFVKEVMLFIQPKPTAVSAETTRYYPHSSKFNWNIDNYGSVVIPFKGMTISMNSAKNYLMYERCIRVYEGHALEIKGSKAYIDGVQADEYTFEMDYYWMMGDNRHQSQDSRYWGFVPEDHIVGKAWFLVSSFDKNESTFSLKKVRWNRTFRSIHGNWAPKDEAYTN